MITRALGAFSLVLIACLCAGLASTSSPAVWNHPPKASESGHEHEHDAQGRQLYKGRPIAGTMSWRGAWWLFREEREQEERPEEMLDALQIQPGDVVADIGAGAGYISLRLSKRVGPEGKVLATDIQPQMLEFLKQNAEQAGVTNITTILCTQTETGLPDNAIDLAIMVDVYHECSDPEAVLQGIYRALKPGGRVVFVEYKAEDPTIPIKPDHKMTVAQVRKEAEDQNFQFRKLHSFLPWQHIIEFTKPTDDAGAAEAGSDSD